MELQNAMAAGQVTAPAMPETAPPPAQADGRVSADAKAVVNDPTPEVPLPIPASPSQTGLVSKASLSDDNVTPKLDETGVSAVQRTLKPYGISMLPEKHDAPKQESPPDIPTD